MNEGNGMNLESMSLEALWTLFPITFVSYTDCFKKVYLEEEKNLRSLLGETIIRINHIGSTSIKNIKTKPIVDLLIEIDFNNKDNVKALLSTPPYILMNETPTELSFVKGYTLDGYADSVFHLHIKEYGDCNELYFRDYLNEMPLKALEYEKLKLSLFKQYQPNRDLYTAGKTMFVNEVVQLAREKYKGRY